MRSSALKREARAVLPEPEILKRLYLEMLRIRRIEEVIADHYKEQEMRCPVHLCIGQEAVSAGACLALAAQDYVMSGHRAHGHYVARGGDMKAMVAEFYGKATGCCRGIGGSMHLVDRAVGFLGATPILGSTIPMAVGAAWAARMRGEDRVAMVFFGDGAAEQGVLHEALNFAVLKKLPVVFLCENNFYSVYSPLSVRQPSGRQIFQVAAGHGLPSEQGDGNDAIQVYQRATWAVDHARSGEGPVFLEFLTYRLREHCGPNYDDQLGYRPPQDVERWTRSCPIARLRDTMLSVGAATQEEIDAIAGSVEREVTEAVAFGRESPFPEAAQLWENVHAR